MRTNGPSPPGSFLKGEALQGAHFFPNFPLKEKVQLVQQAYFLHLYLWPLTAWKPTAAAHQIQSHPPNSGPGPLSLASPPSDPGWGEQPSQNAESGQF